MSRFLGNGNPPLACSHVDLSFNNVSTDLATSHGKSAHDVRIIVCFLVPLDIGSCRIIFRVAADIKLSRILYGRERNDSIRQVLQFGRLRHNTHDTSGRSPPACCKFEG